MVRRKVMRSASAILSVGTLLLSGCTSSFEKAQTTTLTVFAAASLAEVYGAIGKEFEAANPGVHLQFEFAGSQTLVEQLVNGADADLLATADAITMNRAVDAGVVSGRPIHFAENILTIAVEPGNPLDISELVSLTNPDVAVVVCAKGVPCGNATETATEAAGVILRPVSEEQKVTDVLGKVSSGQADAGLVYRTNIATANGAVEAVDFPEANRAVNSYFINTVTGTPRSRDAKRFIEFMSTANAQEILSDAGFQPAKKS